MTAPMDSDEIRNVAINLELLIQLGFYQMFNPNNTKIQNWNVYQLVCITFTAIAQIVVLYATYGFFVEINDTLSNIDLIIITAVHIQNYTNLLKIIVVLFNANTIWKLFNVTRLNFLTSKLCRKNIRYLNKSRDTTIKLTNAYSFLTFGLMMQWILFPTVINTFIPYENNNQRIQNICNFRFPVTLAIYNQYYVVFWVMELIVAIFYLYILLAVEVFLISLCCVINGQYETLTQAYKEIGFENKLCSKDENYECFKSVLMDHQHLYLKSKSFYTVWKPIVLIFIAITSSLIIVESFALIRAFSSSEKISVFTMLKLGSTILYNSFQLFMYCYLFESMNLKRESVNFGLYSSNWMNMDLQFQKLILLTMQINNANQLMMKASPNKIVNLQLFANVMSTCYNMISVLTRTTEKKI